MEGEGREKKGIKRGGYHVWIEGKERIIYLSFFG
jgi:hypothetical protein